jgi:4-amino-4-deoxy-L-arabinose transferase-like glycosyltransferase
MTDRMKLNTAVIAVGLAAGALGTAKTVLEAVTGTPFSIDDLAYQVGNVALVAYYGITACALTLIATLELERRFGERSSSVMAVLPLVAALAAVAYAVLTFEWNPDMESTFWALVVRLVGVGAVVGAVYAYRSEDRSAARAAK